MTRINIVPPKELTDQHLIAEYREIFMVAGALRRRKRPIRSDEIPVEFTLNKGHVKFFYNKGQYLNERYNDLVKEMYQRNFSPDANRFFPLWDFPPEIQVDWRPSKKDMQTVRQRIALRISQKPGWYRYYGQPLKLEV